MEEGRGTRGRIEYSYEDYGKDVEGSAGSMGRVVQSRRVGEQSEGERRPEAEGLAGDGQRGL